MKKMAIPGAWCLVLVWAGMGLAGAQAVEIMDAAGKLHVFHQAPGRVVCLTPYMTQILLDLGQAHCIAALTRQDLVYHAGLRKRSAGSYSGSCNF